MSAPIPNARPAAAKIARWLVERARIDDAIQLLAAHAALGPNDVEGQQLLAEALRLDASSVVARQAFERMEGIQGDHALLDQAIAKFTLEQIARFEREMAPPSFRRAQVGFNNNVTYKGHQFHVQTEDSGLDKPHIITHLFADGGRVIKSHKRIYASEIGRKDVALYVRALMKGQQMEMLIALREGRFDEIVDGRARGGMEVLEGPPNVDVKRVARKKSDTEPSLGAAAAEATAASSQVEASAPSAIAAAPAPEPSTSTKATEMMPAFPVPPTAADRPAPSTPTLPTRALLHVRRGTRGGPTRYALTEEPALVGAEGLVTLPGEKFCHPREAVLRWRGDKLVLEDLDGGNGAFLRIRTRVELAVGDEFVVGDQLFRVEANPTADDEPDPEPTYFYSSPKWPSKFRVVQVFEGGALGATAMARGVVQIGSAIGDIVVGSDPLVSEQHCILEEQAGVVVLSDLDSKTGVFVRLQGEAEIAHGDEILIGRTVLAVDLTPSRAA